MTDKAALRRALRASCPGEAAHADESALLCRHLLHWPPFLQAQVVAGYMPLPHEADIAPLLQAVLNSGRTLALPRCGKGGTMTFYQVDCLERLIPGAFGIPEPPPEAQPILPEALSLILVPLEGVDAQGYRLGKGGGYYDRYLIGCSALRVGVAFTWQEIPCLPHEAWDIPLHALVDCNGIKQY